MPESLDRTLLIDAFQKLGEDLAEQGLFVELAVYGGSALMLQFEWRHSTNDVDAVVRAGYDEAALKASAIRVGMQLGLDTDWLNNAVGMFTPVEEAETLFQLSGCYPSGATPGLRIMLARPHYLLAMKLLALRSFDRGERDLTDARALVEHLDITDEDELSNLYGSIHREPPPPELRLRFQAILRRP